MLRNQRLSLPPSRTTLRRYFASAEMAAAAVFPLFVSCVIVKFSKGTAGLGCRNEYMPKAAAARTASAISTPAASPILCCLAASTTTELPDAYLTDESSEVALAGGEFGTADLL